MKSLPEYFGAAYLINLPERKDRLRSATQEFARVGWTLGPDAVQLFAALKFTDRAGFPSSPSVRGCFHSHMECIRDAHRRGKKSILLIEDDIMLSPSIGRLTPSIISQLESTPWDFFYLGHERTGEIARASSLTTEVRLLPIKTDVLTAHLLAINGRVFSRLLEHLDRVASGTEGDQVFGPMPVDGAFNVFRRINPDIQSFIAEPKLGWQRPSRSDITPRPFDSFKPLRPFIGFLRDLKYAASRWHS